MIGASPCLALRHRTQPALLRSPIQSKIPKRLRRLLAEFSRNSRVVQ